MLKRITLLVLTVLLMPSMMLEAQSKFIRKKADRSVVTKEDSRELIETVLLTEDFSNFTAGSEEAPDGTRLDDADGYIDDSYFNSPGWSGLEVYQAGGCAYITFSEEYGETGMIITPLLNTEGAVYIRCRMRSESPYGDYVGYNICNEYFEPMDSNNAEISNEWTEVSWFTSAGLENSYIYIYSYESNVFIDDIEISACSLSTPTFTEETNITDNSFTANWESVDEADSYIFRLYAQHTAAADEIYYYADNDFSDVISEGTIESPEVVAEMAMDYNNWYIYMPALINGSIGVTGQYSVYNQYGLMQSPVLDLTSDNGNVVVSFTAYGPSMDELSISLFSNADGYYDIASNKTVALEGEGWNEYTVELSGGMEDSYIEIKYLGSGYVYFDDLKLSQNISEGEVKVNNIQTDEIETASLDVVVDEKYADDILFYQLQAVKYVWATDEYTGEEYIVGEILSELTEVRYAPTNGLDVNDVDMMSEEFAYFNDGQLNIYNPNNLAVFVYNINGVCVYSSNNNGTARRYFNDGIYIVKIGEKTMKIINK